MIRDNKIVSYFPVIIRLSPACTDTVAWLLFNGYGASTMAAGSVGKLSFELHVSPGLLWTGLKWALAIGFIGGLFPAVRAARMPVTAALRQL
jgi:putative ABC transport system permease protein